MNSLTGFFAAARIYSKNDLRGRTKREAIALAEESFQGWKLNPDEIVILRQRADQPIQGAERVFLKDVPDDARYLGLGLNVGLHKIIFAAPEPLTS